MGTVECLDDRRRFQLANSNVMGRELNAQMTIDHETVSRAHARIHWAGGQWHLTDVGSLNGTTLGDTSLEPARSYVMALGDIFQLGGDTGPSFRLVDTRPPRAFVIDPDRVHWRLDDAATLCIPSDDDPVVVISHNGLDWLYDIHDASNSLGGWHTFAVMQRTWRIYAPTEGEVTGDRRAFRMEEMWVRFDISSDEEHIQIRFDGPGAQFELRNRAYHYMLLVLARRRLADQDARVAVEHEGWMHRKVLLDMLKIDTKTLSVWLGRARDAVAKKRLRGAQKVIQVRHRGQQLRFGLPKISIRRSSAPYDETELEDEGDERARREVIGA